MCAIASDRQDRSCVRYLGAETIQYHRSLRWWWGLRVVAVGSQQTGGIDFNGAMSFAARRAADAPRTDLRSLWQLGSLIRSWKLANWTDAQLWCDLCQPKFSAKLRKLLVMEHTWIFTIQVEWAHPLGVGRGIGTSLPMQATASSASRIAVTAALPCSERCSRTGDNMTELQRA